MQGDGRRSFLLGAAGAGLLVIGCAKSAAKSPEAEGGEEVTPAEDLMREHGVLNRILLVYDECTRRLDAQQPIPIEELEKSAALVQRFIEQYHEKLEEDFLFPRFEKANKLADLVATLRRQHQAGRVVTGTILRLAHPATLQKDDDRRALSAALQSFARMYRPHEAREDTVLFPALHSVIGDHELHELGEQFEEREHASFGKEGFEGIVAQVGTIEQAFGIHDLNRFTPTQ